jgi:phosphoglycerate-specific signal transduction histidine kinase
LNFVINFGEVNRELLVEMKERIASENLPTGFTDDIKELIDGLADNQNKILHHGKRADGIVKNMLQHSRTQSGITELTDLNELGRIFEAGISWFQGKHKSFHCHFKTGFDKIWDASILFRRHRHTLVNLFNNAFFSMNEKMKLKPQLRTNT